MNIYKGLSGLSPRTTAKLEHKTTVEL